MDTSRASLRVDSQAKELAQKIRHRIQAERLDDGAFFMTEAQLATEYSASRTVTREAVSRLQALGILEGRKRKGLIVRHPDPLRLFSSSLPSLVGSEDDLLELARLRYVLEVGAIELAVQNATDEQVAALAKAADDITAAVAAGDNQPRQDELDAAFHSLILEMTDSRMIAGMQRVLVEFFASVRSLTPTAPPQEPYAQRIAWEHSALADAIRDRDVERARAMIRLHLAPYLCPAPGSEANASSESEEVDGAQS